MRIRPGRTRSIVAGILALAVTVAGVVMLTSFGDMGGLGSASGLGGPPTAFVALWVIIGLAGAGAAFYNAFSKRGLPLYEVDLDSEDRQDGEYCPHCGKPVSPEDQFCRNCGASLE